MGTIRQQMAARKQARRVDTSCDSDRFAVDALLRGRGFKILSRLKGREAVWTRMGRRFPQHLALQEVPAAEVVRARALEHNYRELRCGRGDW